MTDLATEIARKFNAMREVTVIMHYSLHDHEDIISPNTLSFPSITDQIDKKCMPAIRELWLKSLAQNETDISGKILDAEESLDNKFENLLSRALHPQTREINEVFIRAAAYPVPSIYAIRLPLRPKELRLEILNLLVPFEKTRDMLLRLEKILEAPMRALQIGHTAINDVSALRASGTVISDTNNLIIN